MRREHILLESPSRRKIDSEEGDGAHVSSEQNNKENRSPKVRDRPGQVPNQVIELERQLHC